MSERRRKLNPIMRRAERLARSRAGTWYYLNVAPPIDRVLLRLTRGRLSVSIGQQVGLLETVGAKSGETRRNPLLYITDGDRVVLIASRGGNAKHPAWYHNLRANPRVSFLAPRRTGEYVAREAEGAERERLWEEAVDYYAGYATYERRAGERCIPVIVLERA